MRKTNKNKSLPLLALTLTASLAAFGCTTDRMAGNGKPYTGTPNYGPSAPTVTPGTSGGTTAYPPSMTSSSIAPTITGSQHTAESAADAAYAELGRRRVRVLGTSSPEIGPSRVAVSGGGFSYPALQTNPQQTINSSISSPNAGVAITSGAGSNVNGDAALFSTAVAGASQTPSTAGTLVTAAGADLATVAGATGGVPSASGPVGTVTPAAAAAGASAVRVQSGTNGAVTVTNAPSATTGTTGTSGNTGSSSPQQ